MSAQQWNRRDVVKAAGALAAAGLGHGAWAQKPLGVGFIYVGPRDDYGYNQAHAEAVALVKKMPGMKVVEEENVPEPNVITESGRVLVAYHAMLITNIIDEIETVHGIHNITITGNEAQVIKELYDLYTAMTAKNFLEYYHDALENREQLFTMFDLGLISLEEKGKGEVLFWDICEQADQFAQLKKF